MVANRIAARIDPSEITAALGLEAARTHRVGDRKMTPRGTLLEGKD
jgi:hypothetical protein